MQFGHTSLVSDLLVRSDFSLEVTFSLEVKLLAVRSATHTRSPGGIFAKIVAKIAQTATRRLDRPGTPDPTKTKYIFRWSLLIAQVACSPKIQLALWGAMPTMGGAAEAWAGI